jgi:error-prone DNA polymerase
MAMVAAGFSGGLADQLRRAMDSKHGTKKMRSLVEKLRTGMEQRGIGKEAAEQIEQAITAFAQYGFPESHAISFAWLTYASAYLKVHHPGVFYTALLNAWPMGFYHPATVIRDAQRQGVIIRRDRCKHLAVAVLAGAQCRSRGRLLDGRCPR